MIGNGMYKALYVIVYPFFKLFFRCKYVNRDNLPKTGNYILCSNHVHNLDPVLIALGQKRKYYTMAKSELFKKNKLISKFLTYMGAFPVERGKGDTSAVSFAEDVLKDGNSMLIFFEGTRSKTGELLRPKTGVSMIAYQTQSPIIPICITPKGQTVKLFHRNMITFGDPIMPEEFGIEKGTGMEYRNLSRKIMGVISEMREHDKKVMLGDKYMPPVKEEARPARHRNKTDVQDTDGKDSGIDIGIENADAEKCNESGQTADVPSEKDTDIKCKSCDNTDAQDTDGKVECEDTEKG